jgi:putative PIN family toxin of toxin-antitoxin system
VVRRVVLDSSVLVAGFRSRRGASFQLLELLRARRFEIAMSVPLALEYEMVLVRHAKELGLKRTEAEGLVDYLCRVAHRQDIHFLWRPALTDPRDEFILELAVAAACEAIVTHNVRDFASAARLGPAILTPAVFLDQIEGRA